MTDTQTTDGLRSLSSTQSAGSYLRDMWARRDFALALPAESLRASHQDTLLGNVWHLLNPALSVMIYFIVFGGLLGVDRGIDNYMLWLSVGVFTYRLTSSSVQRGANAVTGNRGLMTSFRFPRAILPLAVVLTELTSFAFELSVLAGLAVVTGEGVSRRWLALPLVVALHTCLNLGGAFIAARLADTFRDVTEVIPFAFQLGRFVSGVMFPLDRFLVGDDGKHAWLHAVIVYNPLVRILELYRWVFMGGSLDLGGLARTALICLLVLVFGFRFFRAAEHRYGR